MELDDVASLFAPGEHPVRIGFECSFEDPWSHYENGYFLSAVALIDQLLSFDDEDRPMVIYPILFLSRHYIELALKALIFEAVASFNPFSHSDPTVSLASRLRSVAFDNEHNLTKLWDRLVRIIADNRRKPMIADTNVIRRVLAEFTDLDPFSTNTRYGLKKDFETISLGKYREISLRNLRNVILKLREDLADIRIRFQYVNEPWWDEDLHEAWTKSEQPDETCERGEEAD